MLQHQSQARVLAARGFVKCANDSMNKFSACRLRARHKHISHCLQPFQTTASKYLQAVVEEFECPYTSCDAKLSSMCKRGNQPEQNVVLISKAIHVFLGDNATWCEGYCLLIQNTVLFLGSVKDDKDDKDASVT